MNLRPSGLLHTASTTYAIMCPHTVVINKIQHMYQNKCIFIQRHKREVLFYRRRGFKICNANNSLKL
jgi:hypothetical protein